MYNNYSPLMLTVMFLYKAFTFHGNKCLIYEFASFSIYSSLIHSQTFCQKCNLPNNFKQIRCSAKSIYWDPSGLSLSFQAGDLRSPFILIQSVYCLCLISELVLLVSKPRVLSSLDLLSFWWHKASVTS